MLSLRLTRVPARSHRAFSSAFPLLAVKQSRSFNNSQEVRLRELRQLYLDTQKQPPASSPRVKTPSKPTPSPAAVVSGVSETFQSLKPIKESPPKLAKTDSISATSSSSPKSSQHLSQTPDPAARKRESKVRKVRAGETSPPLTGVRLRNANWIRDRERRIKGAGEEDPDDSSLLAAHTVAIDLAEEVTEEEFFALKAASPRLVQWKCGFGHSFAERIIQRTMFDTPCPKCFEPMSAFTEVMKWFHPTINCVPATSLSIESSEKVIWHCPECSRCFPEVVKKFVKNIACAECTKTRQTKKVPPRLAAQWHPIRNGDLAPNATITGPLWWMCPDCGREWQDTIAKRSLGNWECPDCATPTTS